MFTLQVTQGGQALSGKFKSAAKAGDFPSALSNLLGLNMLDSLISCLELLDDDQNTYANLVRAAGTDNGRPQFSIKLVSQGSMPAGAFLGVTDADLPTARIFVLQVRGSRGVLANQLWKTAAELASTQPFYPEYQNKCSEKRNRVCVVANDHSGLGPHNPDQIALFSLGGRYDFATSDAGTAPKKGTTCILFARSVLHAAGCNVVHAHMSQACNVPLGLDAELPSKAFGFVSADQFNAGVRPRMGDIFFIRGGNYKRLVDKILNKWEDTGIDSTHVGVIVGIDSDGTWSTMEGGSSDHVTRPNSRKLVQVPGPANSGMVKWMFDKDKTTAGPRPLQGWFSIDAIDPTRWM